MSRKLTIGATEHEIPDVVGDYCDEMQEAWEKAEAHANYLASELRWFCGRVERGEIQSKRTYDSFMAALAATDRRDMPEGYRLPEPANSITAYASAVWMVIGSACTLAVVGVIAAIAA